MILKGIHSECQRCANLKTWNIHMNGDHDYCCRCRPSGFISKDLRQEPCEKFVDKNCADCIEAGGDWECDHVHCHKGIESKGWNHEADACKYCKECERFLHKYWNCQGDIEPCFEFSPKISSKLKKIEIKVDNRRD